MKLPFVRERHVPLHYVSAIYFLRSAISLIAFLATSLPLPPPADVVRSGGGLVPTPGRTGAFVASFDIVRLDSWK